MKNLINDIKHHNAVLSFRRISNLKFSLAYEKVLLGGYTEATKALLLATVKEIKVYEDRIDFKGGKLKLLVNVESNKAGNPDGLPCLILMWR